METSDSPCRRAMATADIQRSCLKYSTIQITMSRRNHGESERLCVRKGALYVRGVVVLGVRLRVTPALSPFPATAVQRRTHVT